MTFLNFDFCHPFRALCSALQKTRDFGDFPCKTAILTGGVNILPFYRMKYPGTITTVACIKTGDLVNFPYKPGIYN